MGALSQTNQITFSSWKEFLNRISEIRGKPCSFTFQEQHNWSGFFCSFGMFQTPRKREGVSIMRFMVDKSGGVGPGAADDGMGSSMGKGGAGVAQQVGCC